VECICLDEHLAFDTISSHSRHRMSVRSIHVLEYHDVFCYELSASCACDMRLGALFNF
jgi:hypothetical protein